MNKQDKKRMYELKKKDISKAIWLSLLITGAGHWYLGKWGKGFLMLILQIFLWSFWMGWIMWIITPISARNDARKLNEELKIEYGF